MSKKSFPIDIDFKVNISFGEETDKSFEKINNFASKLADLAKYTQTAAGGTKKLGDIVGSVMHGFDSGGEIIKSFNDFMGTTKETLKSTRLETAMLNASTAKYEAQLRYLKVAGVESTTAVDDLDKSFKAFKLNPRTGEDLTRLAATFDSFSATPGGASVALDRLRRSFSQASILLSDDFMGKMSKSFGKNTGDMLLYINDLDVGLYQSGGRAQLLQKVLADPSTGKMFIESIQQSNLELYKLSLASQMVVGHLGAIRMAQMDLARSFFWTGLGTMFALMSYARLARSGVQIKANELSLTRALETESEAMEKLNRFKERGVSSGRAYTQASMNAKDATMARALAEDRLKDAILNQHLAFMQLVFGTIPTAIRTIVDLSREVMKMVILHTINTAAVDKETVATAMNAAAKAGATITIHGYTLSVAAATVATLALTAAATLGFSAIAAMMASASATDSISKANAEFAKMKSTLTVRHSPALYESFDLMADGINRTSEAMATATSRYADIEKRMAKMKATMIALNEVKNKALDQAGYDQFPDVNRILMHPMRGQDPQGMLRFGASKVTSPGARDGSRGKPINPYRIYPNAFDPGRQISGGLSNGVPITQTPLSKGIQSVTVNVNGNVSVRDDRDLDVLGNRIVASIYRRGG